MIAFLFNRNHLVYINQDSPIILICFSIIPCTSNIIFSNKNEVIVPISASARQKNIVKNVLVIRIISLHMYRKPIIFDIFMYTVI